MTDNVPDSLQFGFESSLLMACHSFPEVVSNDENK